MPSESSGAASFLLTLYKSYLVRITTIIGVVVILFAALAAHGDDTTQFMVTGAVIGFICSVSFCFC